MSEVTFVAVGPFCWGKGKTQQEAYQLARENWSGPPYTKLERGQVRIKHFSIYRIEAYSTEIEVSGFDGSVTWPEECKCEKLQTSSLAQEPVSPMRTAKAREAQR